MSNTVYSFNARGQRDGWMELQISCLVGKFHVYRKCESLPDQNSELAHAFKIRYYY